MILHVAGGVVLLTILTHDVDTGTLLFEYKERIEFSVSGDKIEDCRKRGIEMAHKLSDAARSGAPLKWKGKVIFDKVYPNASTNVDCEWIERGVRGGQDA